MLDDQTAAIVQICHFQPLLGPPLGPNAIPTRNSTLKPLISHASHRPRQRFAQSVHRLFEPPQYRPADRLRTPNRLDLHENPPHAVALPLPHPLPVLALPGVRPIVDFGRRAHLAADEAAPDLDLQSAPSTVGRMRSVPQVRMPVPPARHRRCPSRRAKLDRLTGAAAFKMGHGTGRVRSGNAVEKSHRGQVTAGAAPDLERPSLHVAPTIPVTPFKHLARNHGRMPNCLGVARKHVPVRVGNDRLTAHDVEEIALHAKTVTPPKDQNTYAFVRRPPFVCSY
jgi:hypothetical protein